MTRREMRNLIKQAAPLTDAMKGVTDWQASQPDMGAVQKATAVKPVPKLPKPVAPPSGAGLAQGIKPPTGGTTATNSGMRRGEHYDKVPGDMNQPATNAGMRQGEHYDKVPGDMNQPATPAQGATGGTESLADQDERAMDPSGFDNPSHLGPAVAGQQLPDGRLDPGMQAARAEMEAAGVPAESLAAMDDAAGFNQMNPEQQQQLLSKHQLHRDENGRIVRDDGLSMEEAQLQGERDALANAEAAVADPQTAQSTANDPRQHQTTDDMAAAANEYDMTTTAGQQEFSAMYEGGSDPDWSKISNTQLPPEQRAKMEESMAYNERRLGSLTAADMQKPKNQEAAKKALKQKFMLESAGTGVDPQQTIDDIMKNGISHEEVHANILKDETALAKVTEKAAADGQNPEAVKGALEKAQTPEGKAQVEAESPGMLESIMGFFTDMDPGMQLLLAAGAGMAIGGAMGMGGMGGIASILGVLGIGGALAGAFGLFGGGDDEAAPAAPAAEAPPATGPPTGGANPPTGSTGSTGQPGQPGQTGQPGAAQPVIPVQADLEKATLLGPEAMPGADGVMGTRDDNTGPPIGAEGIKLRRDAAIWAEANPGKPLPPEFQVGPPSQGAPTGNFNDGSAGTPGETPVEGGTPPAGGAGQPAATPTSMFEDNNIDVDEAAQIMNNPQMRAQVLALPEAQSLPMLQSAVSNDPALKAQVKALQDTSITGGNDKQKMKVLMGPKGTKTVNLGWPGGKHDGAGLSREEATKFFALAKKIQV